MNEYRHVCFKDLENYVKKSDYFGGLTSDEQKWIRQNLDVPSMDDLQEKYGGIVEKTYEEIKELVDAALLNPFCTYVVTDFQTIYESNNENEVWGLTTEPSEVYSIVLNPISSNQFSQNVEVLKDGVAMNWIVKYDFTQKVLKDGTKTKGEIVYLQDEHNNRAYYDFKNIKFKVYLDSSDVSGLRNSGHYHLYTFSYIDSNRNVVENSKEASNNHFDQDCYENVFLGVTRNNHFFGGFKQNLFLNTCEFNKFEWNTFNNKFEGGVTYVTGSVQNALIDTTSYDSALSKEFKMLRNQQESTPIFVVTTCDVETLTNQIDVVKLKAR